MKPQQQPNMRVGVVAERTMPAHVDIYYYFPCTTCNKAACTDFQTAALATSGGPRCELRHSSNGSCYPRLTTQSCP